MTAILITYIVYCAYEAYKADTISIRILFSIAATLLTTVGITAAIVG